MAEDNVLIERRDGVLIITINRPEARNSFDLKTADAMSRALDSLENDDQLHVGVLTGAGGHFSAGMDMKAFLRGDVPYVAHRGIFGILNQPPDKPLIASIEGAAIAGGFELMLACDLVVAADDVLLGLPEVKRGLCAAAGGLMKLPRRIPLAIAAELTLTGELINAERGRELGLVNRLAPPGGALDAALELAQAVAANAPLAVKASKEVLYASLDWTSAEAWGKQGGIVGPVLASDDAIEGSKAFSEKRAPRWQGR